MTKGVLLFAYNNAEIDYVKIAQINALMIKHHLKVPITLVTDDNGQEQCNDDNSFDKIINIKKDYSFKNIRNYSDTSYSSKKLQFYNCNHCDAYNISPYDETLIIDCDYLIMSDALSKCWYSTNDFMISSKIYSPIDDCEPYSQNLDDMGIKQYWATVIYFKKTKLTNHIFSLVEDIQKNYNYYRDLYHFSNGMFRNDNAFSIAIHMLSGFNSDEMCIKELPIPGLLMSWDVNDIYSINGIDDITLLVEKKTHSNKFILTKIKDTDIHIINKWSIGRHAKRLLELYDI